MAVGVISYQKPVFREKEESDIDKLGKLLGVAAQGASIYKNLKPEDTTLKDAISNMQLKELKRKEEAAALEKQGVLPASQKVKFYEHFDPSKEGEQGAIAQKFATGDGGVETIYGKRRADPYLGLRGEILNLQANKAKQDIDKSKMELEESRNSAKGPQAQAAVYGKRMEQADRILDQLQASGYDRTSIGSSMGSFLPEALQSSELKMQRQAERNFVNAILRKESGAAISESEFKSAEKQYFPRVGDTPEVLAQKKQNRLQAIEGLKVEAGKAWNLVKTPQVSSGPRVGMVQDGYKFLGGDPGESKNWEKVK